MPSDVFDVSSLRSQLDVTQLTLEQFAVDLVDVVLVLCEAVFVRRNEVALVTRIWLDRRVTDEMFFQLDGRVEAFSTHVADVVFGSVRVVAKLIVLVKKLLFPCRVVAHLTLVNVRIVAVVFLVQKKATVGGELLSTEIADEAFASVSTTVFTKRLARCKHLAAARTAIRFWLWYIAIWIRTKSWPSNCFPVFTSI